MSVAPASDLDKQLSDVIALLALLLVFVIGYFSALLPQAEDLISRTRPNEEAQRLALKAKLGAFRRLSYGLEGLILLVLLLLFSASRQIISTWPSEAPFPWVFSDRFPTARAGVLLVDLLLAAVFLAAIWLIRSLSKRIRQLS